MVSHHWPIRYQISLLGLESSMINYLCFLKFCGLPEWRAIFGMMKISDVLNFAPKQQQGTWLVTGGRRKQAEQSEGGRQGQVPAPLPARACPHSPTYMTQTTRHQQCTTPSTTLPPLITRAARCRCTMPQFHADHAQFSCRCNTPSAAAAAPLRLSLPPFSLRLSPHSYLVLAQHVAPFWHSLQRPCRGTTEIFKLLYRKQQYSCIWKEEFKLLYWIFGEWLVQIWQQRKTNLEAGKSAAASTQCMYLDSPCWSFSVLTLFSLFLFFKA